MMREAEGYATDGDTEVLEVLRWGFWKMLMGEKNTLSHIDKGRLDGVIIFLGYFTTVTLWRELN